MAHRAATDLIDDDEDSSESSAKSASVSLPANLQPRRYKRFLNNIKHAERAGDFFAMIAAIAVAIISTIAIGVLCPWMPVWALVLLGFAGFYVEVTVFRYDLRKVFSLLFGEGITNIFGSIKNNLELEIVLREYQAYTDKIADAAQAKADHESKKISYGLYKAKLGRIEKIQYDTELIIKLRNIPTLNRYFKKPPFDKKKFKEAFLQWRKTHPKQSLFNNSPELNREFRFKRILLTGVLGLAGLNGLCFGLITYAGIISALTIFSFTNPFIPILIAGVFACFATVAFTAVMYRMLSESITNNVFKRIWRRLKELVTPELPWNRLTLADKIKHILKVSVTVSIILTVLGFSIYATIATAGTYMQSATTALKHIFTITHALQYLSSYLTLSTVVTGINTIGTLLVLAFIPNQIAFSCERAVDAASKLFQIAKFFSQAVKHSFMEFKNDPRSYLRDKAKSLVKFAINPIKWLAAALGVITLIATIVHFIAEGALSAVGFKDPTDIVSQKLYSIADFLFGWTKVDIGLLLSTTAFIASASEETLVDADYLLPEQHDDEHEHEHEHDHEHGVSYTSALHLLNKVPGANKIEHYSKKLEYYLFPEDKKLAKTHQHHHSHHSHHHAHAGQHSLFHHKKKHVHDSSRHLPTDKKLMRISSH